jgi:nucleoside-diphosphate-sugar epimerase
MVNPSGVYGPGPSGSASFEESLFRPLLKKRLPAVPPGGCGVVFTEGIGAGQLLAAERGRDGERYILSDRHVTIEELARSVVRVAGRGWVPPTIPRRLNRVLAAGSERLARLGVPPLISAGQAYFFDWNAKPDSTKAQDELGWEPTPLDEGIAATLAAL